MTQEQAFKLSLEKAKQEAPNRYGGDVHRAIRGMMLQHVPEAQWPDFADFYAREGYPLGISSIKEIQRLREICFSADINPDV